MYRSLVLASKVASFIVTALLRAVSKSADLHHTANRKARDIRSNRNVEALKSAQNAAVAARQALEAQSLAFSAEVRAINRIHG